MSLTTGIKTIIMKNKIKMIKAKFTLPKLKTKKVWVGLYGGHYDVIVFFKEKPVLNDDEYYCIIDNKGKALGSMSLTDFYTFYPDADMSACTREDGRPKDVEIYELFEMEITTAFDQWGDMHSIECDEDGWI